MTEISYFKLEMELCLKTEAIYVIFSYFIIFFIFDENYQ